MTNFEPFATRLTFTSTSAKTGTAGVPLGASLSNPYNAFGGGNPFLYRGRSYPAAASSAFRGTSSGRTPTSSIPRSSARLRRTCVTAAYVGSLFHDLPFGRDVNYPVLTPTATCAGASVLARRPNPAYGAVLMIALDSRATPSLRARHPLLLVQNNGLRRRVELGGVGARPAVDRLWRQMFGNGQPISLVLADGNLVEFENQIQNQISLSDYENAAFAKLAQGGIADPALRTLALSLVSRRYTSVADVKAALTMGLVCASNGLPLEVVFARYATTAQVSSHNAILLGSLRANPWVGLFEDQLNFRTVFEESPRAAYFVNRTPHRSAAPLTAFSHRGTSKKPPFMA